jgi:hypothetical protein
MIRNARARAARRNVWTQVGVSACVLLLPPMALGAAVYSMLPARDDSPVRHIANPVAAAHEAATDFGPAAEGTRTVRVELQPLAAAPQPRPAAAKVAPVPAASAKAPYSLASARQEPAGKTAAKESGREPAKETVKDTARVLGPVPVHVTVVVPPAVVAPPPAANTDSAPTGSISVEPARAATAEEPAALLPSARLPPTQIPATQIPATLGLATEVPAAEPRFAARPPEPSIAATPGKRGRFSYFRHLARRNEARAEARNELRAARWNAQSQHAYSLRNWLQQLNTTRQRDTHS